MDTKTKKKANTKKKTKSSKEIETEIFEEKYRYQWRNRH